jgi:hypothetical protein
MIVHFSRTLCSLSNGQAVYFKRNIQLNPIYEEQLVLADKKITPDFTIKDDDTGKTYYWEHCGMLDNEIYSSKWNKKKKLYEKNGIKLLGEGEGENGILIFTSDSKDKGISIPEIDEIINKII